MGKVLSTYTCALFLIVLYSVEAWFTPVLPKTYQPDVRERESTRVTRWFTPVFPKTYQPDVYGCDPDRDRDCDRDKRDSTRAARYAVVDNVQHGKSYSIQNLKDKLYLSAKSGRSNPSPVVMTKFTGGENQIWSVSQLGNGVTGYSLKSLKNEFNEVTSRLEYFDKKSYATSHSFIPWTIEKVSGAKVGRRNDVPFSISYMSGKTRLCLQSNGLLRRVSRVKCNPSSLAQLWEFRDENDGDDNRI